MLNGDRHSSSNGFHSPEASKFIAENVDANNHSELFLIYSDMRAVEGLRKTAVKFFCGQ